MSAKMILEVIEPLDLDKHGIHCGKCLEEYLRSFPHFSYLVLEDFLQETRSFRKSYAVSLKQDVRYKCDGCGIYLLKTNGRMAKSYEPKYIDALALNSLIGSSVLE